MDAIDDTTLTELLKHNLLCHQRLQKPEHKKHIDSLCVYKDIDSDTNLQQIEDNGRTYLYVVEQKECQDAFGMRRRLPEITNLRVCGEDAIGYDAIVSVAFYSLDGSDGSDEIDVSFPVRAAKWS